MRKRGKEERRKEWMAGEGVSHVVENEEAKRVKWGVH
jgi:hypothetical protein